MCPVCQSCVNCRWCCETPCVQCDIVSTVCSPYCCVDSTGLTAALGVCYGEITLQVYMTSTGHRLSSRLYFSILYRFKVYLINLFPHIAPVFEVFHATFRPPPPGFCIFTQQGNTIAVVVFLPICVALRSHL